MCPYVLPPISPTSPPENAFRPALSPTMVMIHQPFENVIHNLVTVHMDMVMIIQRNVRVFVLALLQSIPLVQEMIVFHVLFCLLLVCPNGTYADSHTGTRTCVALCPPGVTNSVAAPNLYGDPTTHTCVAKCITPHTWADSHTRLCESECTSSPPTYSENIAMTCVTSLNCPSSPTMTFGDNTTRSCTK